jgi:uncharacterized protein YbjQ (UPF0145 family)
LIITTTEKIEGKSVKETLGLARGNTIRAKHVGKDIMAAFRNLAGGEITEYVQMMAQAREEALKRMTDEAEKLGANAVIGVRFATSMVMQNASEILAYGTAVIIE